MMLPHSLEDLKIQIYADGADKEGIIEMYQNPFIKGFTTNPTLMRKAGIEDYKAFALDILHHIPDLTQGFRHQTASPARGQPY